MKYYNKNKFKKYDNFFYIPYAYHVQKYSEGSYDWLDISRHSSFKSAKLEFERVKLEYPSLHFRLIQTIDIS